MEALKLSETILFYGNTEEEIREMLNCLKAERKHFQRGELIYRAGELVSSMGMVLSGSVNIEVDDFWGNKSILNHIEPGHIFAETYACLPKEPLMVNVIAAEKAEVLFLNAARLLRTCPDSCPCHNHLISNLLAVTSQKNLNLSRRILHTASKSIRGRLISYLSFEASRQGTQQFCIPFNRQQLADYLSVDRSALSNELSKMQKEGILEVNRNQFRMLQE